MYSEEIKRDKTRCQISISVDVDTLRYYANFAPNGHINADPTLSYTMPQLLGLFEELNIRATLFVIGETVVEHPGLWRQAAEAGHELASHSYTHPQAFHQLTSDQKRREILESKKIIEDCIGQSVIGFRAPAYNIDLEVLNLLLESGYHYDSSFFPGWYVPLSKLVTRLLSPTYQLVQEVGDIILLREVNAEQT